MEPTYHFTFLKSKAFNVLTDKNVLDYLVKWSIKGQLKLATFCFNEFFQTYKKNEFVENFFNDKMVMSVLNEILPNWQYSQEKIENIDAEIIPCTVTSLSFFDRLLDEENRVVREGGAIRHCLDDYIDGFIVADELRKLMIDEESDNYGLFNEVDRNQLIFKIFQFLVFGGKWCQYEDNINPYLDVTKIIYKDLVRVEKNQETKKIEVKSICIKIVMMGKNKLSVFPVDSDHFQNFAYLIVNPALRQVTVFAHEFGGQF